MSYTVLVKKTAQKQISKLPSIYLNKVKNAILALENTPRPIGCIKLAGSENVYRIRVGPYRIVYSIEDDKLIVFIFDVDDRKDVYK